MTDGCTPPTDTWQQIRPEELLLRKQTEPVCQWWSEKHSRHYVVDPDTQEPKRLSGSDDDVDAEDDVEADDADVSSDAT